MIIGYEFLNMYPALICAHSKKKPFCSFECVAKLMFLIRVSRKCSYIRVTQILTVTYTMLDSEIWNI